jgi:hypothetical protein
LGRVKDMGNIRVLDNDKTMNRISQLDTDNWCIERLLFYRINGMDYYGGLYQNPIKRIDGIYKGSLDER